MNIYFIRHGYAYHNQLAEEIGDIAYFDKKTEDSPLLEKGIDQAKYASKELINIDFDYVFCSPSLRCIQTLENLISNKNVQLFDILMEPQGEHFCNKRKNIDELANFCSELSNNYNITNVNQKYNFEKETYQNFIERTKEFYKYLVNLKNINSKNILIVSHHDWIKVFFKYNLDIDYYPKNCEIRKIIL